MQAVAQAQLDPVIMTAQTPQGAMAIARRSGGVATGSWIEALMQRLDQAWADPARAAEARQIEQAVTNLMNAAEGAN